MPIPLTTIARAPDTSRFKVVSDPVAMFFQTLTAIAKEEDLSGYDTWVKEIAAQLTPEQTHRNELVVFGLHYAVLPDRPWASFPEYIAHLDNADPAALRENIFVSYEKIAIAQQEDDNPIPMDWNQLMQDRQAYLNFLQTYFTKQIINIDLESEAFDLMVNLPAMQGTIVTHMQFMWDKFFRTEWDRVLPDMEVCVDAYQEVTLNDLSPMDAAKKVIGTELTEMCAWALNDEDTQAVTFVPSPHIGPYVGVFKTEQMLWIVFGARLPEGSKVKSPALSRAELLVRLDTLADDIRLQILGLIVEHGEMCSKDIMDQLDLSQSAASRHLKQLSATGYLVVRRKESAKCYKIHEARIENTINALQDYFIKQ